MLRTLRRRPQETGEIGDVFAASEERLVHVKVERPQPGVRRPVVRPASSAAVLDPTQSGCQLVPGTAVVRQGDVVHEAQQGMDHAWTGGQRQDQGAAGACRADLG